MTNNQRLSRAEPEPTNRPYYGVQEPSYTEGGKFGRQDEKLFGETQPGSLAGVADYEHIQRQSSRKSLQKQPQSAPSPHQGTNFKKKS